jgi:RNA polymerase sigma factor (TIGR02999 family)
MPSTSHNITQLLAAWGRGDEAAREELLPIVYDELRRIARSHLARERRDHTLQPTALVNEVYLLLVDQREINWQSRAHFFGIAARLMRQILMHHAEARRAAKRGGQKQRLSLSDVDQLAGGKAGKEEIDALALDEALRRLERIDAPQCRIVELRFFGGLTIEETAEVLATSPATVKREWNAARAWLRHALSRA